MYYIGLGLQCTVQVSVKQATGNGESYPFDGVEPVLEYMINGLKCYKSSGCERMNHI